MAYVCRAHTLNNNSVPSAWPSSKVGCSAMARGLGSLLSIQLCWLGAPKSPSGELVELLAL